MNPYIRIATRFLLTGRGPVMLAAALLLLALGTLYVATGSMKSAWGYVGVTSRQNTFTDLRVVTHTVPCANAGFDAYVKDVCDTYWSQHPRPDVPEQHNLFNYPPIWLKTSYLGVSPSSTNLVGVIIGLAAMLAFLRILRPRTIVGGLVSVAAILSPSILLGFERGNIDLIIFAALVCLIVMTQQCAPPIRSRLRAVGIVLLTVLKFFPVAAATLLIRSRRGWVVALATSIVAVAAAWLAADGRFATVLSNTPKPFSSGFGSLPIFIVANKVLGGTNDVSRNMSLLALSMSLVAFLVVSVPMLRKRLPRPLPRYLPAMDDTLNGSLAMAGISIFCAAFLFGASYDYRLIFLILALPLLISAYEDDKAEKKRLYAPLVIVAFLWLSRVTMKILLADEILDWMIFAVGSAWIFSALVFRPADGAAGADLARQAA